MSTTLRQLCCTVVCVFSAATCFAAQPRIAIIIDDLGHQLARGQRTIDLPGPVACAVIPHTAYSTALAERAHAAGKEVLLHLHMQSAADLPGEPEALEAAVELPHTGGAIGLETSRSALEAILTADLADVPHSVGVNNHQGSLVTRHPGHMAWLMDALRVHGDLFFVDSYTTAASVAYAIAQEKGVPATRRDVFLDNERSADRIAREFERLKREARAHGYAVAIGHPYPETLAFLEAELPRLAEQGFELVPVSELVGMQLAQPVLAAGTMDGVVH